ncbi:sporulation protein YqfC [Salibacterium salarium]|uniref:Sporulation protein YqfC n=1 Tax=Salibacterium salarium TaxID=284579 RepID=A0A3R9QI26_9BACI|nr:sporulation protein YqfC [Salibacterium salarium]RSL30891.1 sporulation protein YqfC [Salibacterium salarium]
MLTRMKRSMKQWMTEKLSLPEDILMDVPRLTMIGQLHLHVENHRGVLHFSNEYIRLKLSQGELIIQGEDFVIKKIYPEELLLEGVISEVKYSNGHDKGGWHEEKT